MRVDLAVVSLPGKYLWRTNPAYDALGYHYRYEFNTISMLFPIFCTIELLRRPDRQKPGRRGASAEEGTPVVEPGR